MNKLLAELDRLETLVTIYSERLDPKDEIIVSLEERILQIKYELLDLMSM